MASVRERIRGIFTPPLSKPTNYDDAVARAFCADINRARAFLVDYYKRTHANHESAEYLHLTHAWAGFEDEPRPGDVGWKADGWLTLAVSSHHAPAYFGRGKTVSDCVDQIVAKIDEARAWTDQDAIGRTLGIIGP